MPSCCAPVVCVSQRQNIVNAVGGCCRGQGLRFTAPRQLIKRLSAHSLPSKVRRGGKGGVSGWVW